jgi:hypothetical protein
LRPFWRRMWILWKCAGAAEEYTKAQRSCADSEAESMCVFNAFFSALVIGEAASL